MREATESATRRLLGIALQRLCGSPPLEIIDFGSGPGGSAHLLACETGATVTCVDLCDHHNLENAAIAQAMGLAERIRTWTGSFERLPSGWSARFDLAWSQEALCHSRDKPAALREARRVVRPGGVLVFSDILLAENAPADKARVFSEVNAVTEWTTAEGYLHELAKAGFDGIVHHDWTPHLKENFQMMRLQIARHRDSLLAEGVLPELIERFTASLDERISWAPGEVLQWGVFSCRRVG
jgi:sarcosine/dimethylglycine N-methyltransferase